MYCPRCGKKIPDQSIFCMFCGTSILKVEEESPPLPVTPQPAAPLRRCTVCGRPLPETSISDVCVTCLYNRNFVAQPASEPESAPAQKTEDAIEEDIFKSAYTASLGESHPPARKHFNIQFDDADTIGEIEDEDIIEDGLEDAIEEDEPVKPRKTMLSKQKTLKIVLLSVIGVFVVSGIFLLFSTLFTEFTSGYTPPRNNSSSSDSTQSNAPQIDRALFLAAQQMVREKAYSPDSVHFETRTLEVQEESPGVFTVSQEFERLTPSGETQASNYIAVLQEDSSLESGYKPLMLQVDGTVLYDYR